VIEKLAQMVGDRVIVLAVIVAVVLLALNEALDGRAAFILGSIVTAVFGVKAASSLSKGSGLGGE
jgi:hypothetical protein